MANSSDYLRNYGGVSFTELPFNAVDSFALCQSFYLPVEKVYKNLNKDDVTLRELYMKSFELRGSRHKAVGVILSRQISIRAVELARSARFGSAKVTDFSEVFATQPAIQFCAMTLALDDGTTAIVFRGTDDSIIGWKEDVDLLVKKSMPSHQLALDYLEKAAANSTGDIVLCGHSKGGNLALWAALQSKDSTRARIKGLYNLEGPGFYNYHLYHTPAYKELLDRYYHIIPHGAFIGVMLAHDDDYEVVKSSFPSGPFQHDLTSWMVEEDHPVYMPGLNLVGRFNDLLMKKVMDLIPVEHYGSIEKVADAIVKGAGQLYLTGFTKNLRSSIKGAVDAWNSTDAEMKNEIMESFKGLGAAVPGALKEAITGEQPAAETPAEAPAEA
ncbi:MAG: DUF2974 domain-containing protein [Clostridia bacterium]|nr:DUF2974 domain-containing protein [Clostridia bacterium]